MRHTTHLWASADEPGRVLMNTIWHGSSDGDFDYRIVDEEVADRYVNDRDVVDHRPEAKGIWHRQPSMVVMECLGCPIRFLPADQSEMREAYCPDCRARRAQQDSTPF
jgi:hypothetical protein